MSVSLSKVVDDRLTTCAYIRLCTTYAEQEMRHVPGVTTSVDLTSTI